MSTAGNSPRKEQSEQLSRKTVHQAQMPVEYLYLSLVPSQASCPDFLQGRSSEEGHWHQFGLVVRPVRSHRVPSSGERRSGLSDSLLVDPPNSTESHCASSEETKRGRVTETGTRGLQRDAAFRVVPEMGPSQC